MRGRGCTDGCALGELDGDGAGGGGGVRVGDLTFRVGIVDGDRDGAAVLAPASVASPVGARAGSGLRKRPK